MFDYRMVKIDTIYKVWQEQNLDMEDEESNAIKFLSVRVWRKSGFGGNCNCAR